MIIAIDPGANGGIAYKFKGKIYAEKMPQTPRDIYDFLYFRSIESDGYEDVVVYLEKVGGYRSGNSGPAAVNFARHCGHIDMALLALNIEYHEVLPTKWM